MATWRKGTPYIVLTDRTVRLYTPNMERVGAQIAEIVWIDDADENFWRLQRSKSKIEDAKDYWGGRRMPVTVICRTRFDTVLEDGNPVFLWRLAGRSPVEFADRVLSEDSWVAGSISAGPVIRFVPYPHRVRDVVGKRRALVDQC